MYGVGHALRSSALLNVILVFRSINLMEKAKRKERHSSENKRQRDKSGSSECDEVFEALNMAEDIGANIQQILTKLQKLDSLEALINKTLNKLEAVELQVNRLTIRVESECKSKAVDEAVGKLRASVVLLRTPTTLWCQHRLEIKRTPLKK